MTDDREDRIRTRAYALWEEEGRPEGREEAHWAQATQELGAEGAGPMRSGDIADQAGLRAPSTATKGRQQS